MTTEQETTTLEHGQAKRLAAVEKLQQARDLMNSAADDLAMLEGPGYCEHYQAVQNLQYDLGKRTSAISQLEAPTGMFQI